MTERVYNVPDVSCEHCVAAITSELSKIDGVQSVNVDLQSKQVTVDVDSTVSDDSIRAGIDEAGFDIKEG